MELNKKMLVKVTVLLFLMGFSATAEAGRRQLDPSFIITQVLNKKGNLLSYSPVKPKEECCKTCACTLTWPHRVCFCGDVAESCPAACKSCVCTEPTEDHGRECYCEDIAEDNCYIPACYY